MSRFFSVRRGKPRPKSKACGRAFCCKAGDVDGGFRSLAPLELENALDALCPEVGAARLRGVSAFELSGVRYYNEDHKRGTFELGAPNDHFLKSPAKSPKTSRRKRR